MGLPRTPPQVVYPRSTFITPTPQGGPSTQPLSTSRAPSPPPIEESPEDPITPQTSIYTSIRQSSNGAGFTPLSARVTPIAAARPIITQSENGPLNAHINSLNKQLVELEALKKDLNARLADSEKKLDSETSRRDRIIRDLSLQYEKEKQEWKDTLNAVQIIHNIAHQRARHELEQERLNYFNSESRILQQNVRILVRDHSLTRFQVHEAQVGKESASYQDQLMDAKDELDELQRMLGQATESYEKELVGQKESIKSLKQQLEHERKSRGSIENGKESLENTNAELTSDLERTRRELASAQSKIKELQSGATEAKSTQKSLEKMQSKHESQLEKLNDLIDSLNGEKVL
ncbi:Nucleoprotein TPR [Rhizoctonia solani]|uniref:Nucleoprotein TPR n=1 Tax=Rhizoctonia solani TaxID=456999 RepID=A0A8H8NRQ3_9AGAM|nr:Nucleoprotein TPR [Rhizoctonia solani]QRW18110.1 Nucleoprotein TPR [Rhizoctonia solani]